MTREYIPPRPCGGEWELTSTPRRFRLMRSEDATGVSGTGHVADGVQFPDGACVLRWRTAVFQSPCGERQFPTGGR